VPQRTELPNKKKDNGRLRHFARLIKIKDRWHDVLMNDIHILQIKIESNTLKRKVDVIMLDH
jgi:hypothetical protein